MPPEGDSMRTRVAIASVVALLLVVAYVRAQQFGNQPAKLNIVKVKGDLFVIHNDFVPGNTTALVTNEGVVLVDDKFEQDAPNILSLLKTVTNQPVKYVVNTHHHGDHSGGNARMQMAGAQLIASEQARRYMVDGKQPGQPGVTFVDRALQLDFDTVVPGHGDVTTKAELRTFRDSTLAMRTRVHEMLMQKKSKDEISAVLKSDFQGAQLVF